MTPLPLGQYTLQHFRIPPNQARPRLYQQLVIRSRWTLLGPEPGCRHGGSTKSSFVIGILDKGR